MNAISCSSSSSNQQQHGSVGQLHRTALSVLLPVLLGPYALALANLNLEHSLIDRLSVSLEEPDPFMQVPLLEVILAAIKLRQAAGSSVRPTPIREHKRALTQESIQSARVSIADGADAMPKTPPPPPASLIKCLQAGLASTNSRPVLDSWVNFLIDCLPFYSETIFQILIPLIETLCTQVGQTFSDLQQTFKGSRFDAEASSAPESTLISLLNGTEQVLARGHARLLSDESRATTIKIPEQPQGFFGNMISGVLTSETPQARSITANNRLTVLLSFQDAVRMCFAIWAWGVYGPSSQSQDTESLASFNYTSLRMRNRARRLLEHLFAAEALECMETVVEIWRKARSNASSSEGTAVFNLLHVLDGSRPKYTIPAIFNAIYSRTNPSALEAARKSTLTSTLMDNDLVVFLVEYARTLEDDAMDEIWTDCMTFLKDILANPFPHRQTLPYLVEFAAILGEKADNTNFGEQRRMRRELGVSNDVCGRKQDWRLILSGSIPPPANCDIHNEAYGLCGRYSIGHFA